MLSLDEVKNATPRIALVNFRKTVKSADLSAGPGVDGARNHTWKALAGTKFGSQEANEALEAWQRFLESVINGEILCWMFFDGFWKTKIAVLSFCSFRF